MRKRIMIGAAIAAAVLIIILAVILICFPKGKTVDSGDTASQYPYTFTENRDNLTVTITGGKEGYAWAVSSADHAVVIPSEPKVSDGSTSFVLKPNNNGSSRVTFELLPKGREYNGIYRIYIDLRVTKKEFAIVGSGHLEIPAEMSDAGGRFLITLMDEGSYLVRMSPTMNAYWEGRNENGNVEVLRYDLWDIEEEPDAEESDDKAAEAPTLTSFTYFTLNCAGTQADTVYIYDSGRGEALKIDLEYDDALGLHPVTYAMVDYPRDRPVQNSTYTEDMIQKDPGLTASGYQREGTGTAAGSKTGTVAKPDAEAGAKAGTDEEVRENG